MTVKWTTHVSPRYECLKAFEARVALEPGTGRWDAIRYGLGIDEKDVSFLIIDLLLAVTALTGIRATTITKTNKSALCLWPYFTLQCKI